MKNFIFAGVFTLVFGFASITQAGLVRNAVCRVACAKPVRTVVSTVRPVERSVNLVKSLRCCQ